ncbi:MAG TPA: PAS domain-containing protein, partial [Pyrinomonadaceae bacterium]|nr:PAS domain-containing protein [Pyrinomonadaceae bacterium]
MKRRGSLFVVLSFAVLTITLTGIVIFAWEKLLMTPFYARVEAMYPGEANSSTRWRVEQRIEHFVISTTVDVIVVTLLLRLVGRQQRKLAASEERYRALFEHANDGIAIVTADSHSIIEVNNKFCDIFRCRPQELVGKDIRDPVWGLLGGLVCDTLPALLDGSGGGESEVSIHDSAGVERPVSVS